MLISNLKSKLGQFGLVLAIMTGSTACQSDLDQADYLYTVSETSAEGLQNSTAEDRSDLGKNTIDSEDTVSEIMQEEETPQCVENENQPESKNTFKKQMNHCLDEGNPKCVAWALYQYSKNFEGKLKKAKIRRWKRISRAVYAQGDQVNYRKLSKKVVKVSLDLHRKNLKSHHQMARFYKKLENKVKNQIQKAKNFLSKKKLKKGKSFQAYRYASRPFLRDDGALLVTANASYLIGKKRALKKFIAKNQQQLRKIRKLKKQTEKKANQVKAVIQRIQKNKKKIHNRLYDSAIVALVGRY